MSEAFFSQYDHNSHMYTPYHVGWICRGHQKTCYLLCSRVGAN